MWSPDPSSIQKVLSSVLASYTDLRGEFGKAAELSWVFFLVCKIEMIILHGDALKISY